MIATRGGDEFNGVLEHLPHWERIHTPAKKLVDARVRPVELCGENRQLTDTGVSAACRDASREAAVSVAKPDAMLYLPKDAGHST